MVSRDEILNHAWSADEYPTPRTVDNFIMRLRRLVEEDPENPRVIKSVRKNRIPATVTLIKNALLKLNQDRPPVWFMRQAGRYHAPYQELRKKYSFVDLCKIPAVACEATMGPMRDFHFDAAILFSDLLFPLEGHGNGTELPRRPALGLALTRI